MKDTNNKIDYCIKGMFDVVVVNYILGDHLRKLNKIDVIFQINIYEGINLIDREFFLKLEVFICFVENVLLQMISFAIYTNIYMHSIYQYHWQYSYSCGKWCLPTD